VAGPAALPARACADRPCVVGTGGGGDGGGDEEEEKKEESSEEEVDMGGFGGDDY